MYIVDADDIQLVEMLAELGEGNEITTNIDDDSILGSQYSVFSEPAKNDRKEEEEEEEFEDLNITSLDLNSLSSWETVHKGTDQCDNLEEAVHNKDNHESSNNLDVTEQINYKDVTLMNFPQLDGATDFYENVSEYEKETLNYLCNEDDTTYWNTIQNRSKNVKFIVPVISAVKDYTAFNLHRNLRLTDIIEYVVNNPNRYRIKVQLYNFINKCYFHIFIKNSKNLQALNTNSLNVDTNVIDTNVIKKKCYLQNTGKIVYNKKIKELCVIQYQLLSDHQDLDVYDIDETEPFEVLEDINQYCLNYKNNKYVCEQHPKSYFQHRPFRTNSYNHDLQQNLSNFSMKFTIPSVDGATATDSSESEPENDVTIDKQEKRICVYKSCKKNTASQSAVQCTPKQRGLDFNDDRVSPGKRRNIGVKTPKRLCYDSPSKMARSPQTGNYSPLNITITSPKTSRSPILQCESPKRRQFIDVASTSATPKHKIHPLRVNLLREKCTVQGNLFEQLIFIKNSFTRI